MSKIQVKLKAVVDNSYQIALGSGLDLVKSIPPANRYIIISDSNVARLYGCKLLSGLKKKARADLLTFKAGEKSKSRSVKARLEDKMLGLKCGRDTMVIALGGGVTGDLAGFVSATYMRGVPYTQIPTTLLAMVDSSVGGKTAIDTEAGKNLIGAFYQPKKVLLDADFLKTLPLDHLINGLIEAIKMFLTHDSAMFEYVQENLDKILKKDKAALLKIIKRAAQIKARVVEKDEKEAGARAVLNLGHSVGHALEKLSQYKLAHGQAVGAGLAVEAKLAQNLGFLTAQDFKKIESIMARLKIDKKMIGQMVKKFGATKILQAMKSDKKNRYSKNQAEYRLVMLETIGQAAALGGEYSLAAPKDKITQALNYFKN
ncbi:MAG: 3-dehydroquinate synthase [Candidatus Magasanikbacteria bacterium CG10_big_fil_rev_8_21_14_0_10_40_10]|uniref:3-dehydroquinate synthase n=1 Tax=Candidatus Magasanikbacteria bacterium CG10_big_fil_rev_8_21_14_0_10_40_10 TaxID=1974648 RepID=A0A2M6W430_9BACT|nr:MAG: 3-dehydroquinate synthase [Candidatus Magasanikbacteria bacterium CG10_big_fil_rev_8_21_14_0_10_40_10]